MNFMVLWEHWPTFAKLDPTESADCTTPLVDWASLLILSGGRGLSSLKSIRRYSWVGSIWQHKKHPLITLDHTPMEKEQHMGTWTCPRFFSPSQLCCCPANLHSVRPPWGCGFKGNIRAKLEPKSVQPTKTLPLGMVEIFLTYPNMLRTSFCWDT